jgi:hypothetical protein
VVVKPSDVPLFEAIAFFCACARIQMKLCGRKTQRPKNVERIFDGEAAAHTNMKKAKDKKNVETDKCVADRTRSSILIPRVRHSNYTLG